MGKKAIVWIFRATNKRNLKPKDLDMDKKGNPNERNLISSNRSSKQRHKNQLC